MRTMVIYGDAHVPTAKDGLNAELCLEDSKFVAGRWLGWQFVESD